MTSPLTADNLFDLLKVGERAASRHKRKVIDALREGAKNLLVNQDVVTASGGKRVRVRVRMLETPTFRFDYHDNVNVGIGKDGHPEPGDILIDENEGEDGEDGEGGDGDGSTYEVEMSVDELIDLLMEAWALPNLEAKKRNEVVSEDYVLGDISRKGPMSRVHKKRTLKNAIARSIATDRELIIHNDDLRFRSPKDVVSYSSSAVIVLIRDRSGSMGPFERKVSRMLSIWLVQFLRRRYDKVAIRFVLHDHAADEVDEHTFYNVASGGGTNISEGYIFAQKVLDEYPESEWNRYAVSFSDGGDFDVESSIAELRRMLPTLQAFFYTEIANYGVSQASEFWQAQHGIEEEFDNFIRYSIASEDEIGDALRAFLSGNE